MNLIRKIIVLFVVVSLTATTSTIKAQSNITAELSQAITKFQFKNSEGVKDLSYSFNLSNNYHIGYKYTIDNGAFLHSNIGLRKAGATLVYEESNYQWNLNYFDFRIGGGYAYELNGIDIYLSLTPYFSYLLTGNQILNNKNYDMIKEESIKRSDIGLFISPGAQMKLSNSISAYAQFDSMLGLKNIENSTEGQQNKNLAFSLSLGLTFSLDNNASKSF